MSFSHLLLSVKKKLNEDRLTAAALFMNISINTDVNMLELAELLIYICSPMAGHKQSEKTLKYAKMVIKTNIVRNMHTDN